jgi:hypothetical protein
MCSVSHMFRTGAYTEGAGAIPIFFSLKLASTVYDSDVDAENCGVRVRRVEEHRVGMAARSTSEM